MKLYSFYVSAFLLTLIACNDEKKEKNSSAESPLNTTQSTSPSAPASKSGLPADMDARAEELKKLTPLSLDQLKTLLPAEVNGVPRSDFNGISNAKLANASAKYVKDGNHQLRIAIQDCASEGGYNIYRAQYAMVANASYATATDDNYFKAIDFKGGKATEAYNKNASTVDFNYIANDRLLITLSAKGMTPEEVKQLAQSLTFTIQ